MAQLEGLSGRWLEEKATAAYWSDSLVRQQEACGWTIDIRFKIEWRYELEAEERADKIMKEMEELEVRGP